MVQDDGLIDYPEGIDATTTGYAAGCELHVGRSVEINISGRGILPLFGTI